MKSKEEWEADKRTRERFGRIAVIPGGVPWMRLSTEISRMGVMEVKEGQAMEKAEPEEFPVRP